MRVGYSSIAIFLSISLFAGMGGVLVGQEGAIAGPVESQARKEQVNELEKVIEEGNQFIKDQLAEKALAKFEIAIRLSRSIQNKPREAFALVSSAYIYEYLDNPKKALELYQQALLLRQEIEDRPGEARVYNYMGLIYRSLGNAPKALEYLNNALNIVRDMKDPSIEAIVLGNIGLVYDDLKQYRKAAAFYDDAFILKRDVANKMRQPLKNVIHQTCQSQQDRETRLRAFHKAMQSVAPTSPLAIDNIDMNLCQLNQEGKIFLKQAKYDEAMSKFNAAIKICRKSKDTECQATLLGNIASVDRDRGNYRDALKHYKESYALLDKSDRTGLAISLNNMGSMNTRIGNYTLALEQLRDALRAIDGEDHPALKSVRASIIQNVSGVWSKLGDYSEALKYAKAALKMASDDNDLSLVGHCHAAMGELYYDLKDYDKSLENLHKSLEIFERLGAKSLLSPVLISMGESYRSRFNQNKVLISNKDEALKAKNEALKAVERALAISQEINQKSFVGQAYILQGAISLENGDYMQASQIFQKAERIAEDLSDKSLLNIARGNIGVAYQRNRDYAKAFEHTKSALMISQEISEKASLARFSSNLGYLLRQQNKIDHAISIYKQSINTYEIIRDNLNGFSRTEQAFYTQNIAEDYRNLTDLLIQQGRFSEAQQVIELLKIRELKEIKLNKSQAPTRQLAISEAEKQSIAQINPEIAKEITPQTLPPADRLSPNPLNQSAQAILNAQPNSALIYHLLTDKQLWILLITPDGKIQKFASSGDKKAIETLTQQYRQQIETCEPQNAVCDKTDTQALTLTSQQLYQQLFPTELQTALQKNKPTHLTLALDGTLRNIPIAALHTGQQYLIEKYTLSTIIAAQLTNTQDTLPSDPNKTPILAVGTDQYATIPVPDYINPTGQDQFLALRNVPVELEAILKSDRNPNAFPGQQLLNDAFNLQNLEQKIPKHTILHISSHGIFRANSLDYSYILLGNGPDRKWSIPKLDSTQSKLFQNTHLVSLSICQGNLSDRDKNGIEIAGISHAFLSQGAKSVQASLWQVEDTSTTLFMQQFYQNLHQNPSKAQALQKAQLQLLKTRRSTLTAQLRKSLSDESQKRFPVEVNSDLIQKNKIPDYSHPYYWAAFTLIGNSR